MELIGSGGRSSVFPTIKPWLACRVCKASFRVLSEMNFSGTYQCALFAATDGHNKSWDLISGPEPPGQQLDNRGKIIAQQLEGSCGATPRYGTRRSFALRGMRLELTLKDLNCQPSRALKQENTS